MKGYLGHASAELVRLDTYIALLSKSEDFIKHKSTDLEITLTIYPRYRAGNEDRNSWSVFRSTLAVRLVITTAD